MVRTMTPEDCSKYLDVAPQAIREALKLKLVDFGFATNPTGNRWVYTIISTRFFDYIKTEVPEEWKGQE